MNTLHSFGHKSTIGLLFMLMAFVLVLPLTRSAPLEEAKLLRQIADQYSAPLVASFLHSRILKNEEMISKIKSSLKDLDQSKIDVFGLAEKTLELLDEQLSALENANYFDFNGTEKVKYFIEQFIMQNEMYPVEFGSYGSVKVAFTADALLEDLTLKTSDALINSTNTMIQTYLTDIDEKERSFGSNRMQKLAAYLARRELQLLANYEYPPNYYNYANNDLREPRKVALGIVLRKVKTIVDFFYSQFNHLSDLKSTTKANENSVNESESKQIQPALRVAVVQTESTTKMSKASDSSDFDVDVVTINPQRQEEPFLMWRTTPPPPRKGK
ncbi:uncharacterized protein LOC107369206 [Tetranychus urticae]|uniref:uncharacterized protein LOC107369206 n=1 Tax=Tetranychus urticae TaxID=32264 RepID=UPI00077BB1A5|nr:uncharacterized protein LOC107369206 [Tetranychus urticae]